MRKNPLFKALLGLIGSVGAVSVQATDWPQFGYDQAHSGNNTAERGYSTATGNTLAYSAALGTGVDGAPVFLGNVATSTGTKDVLFVVALNGTLFALNAANGSVLWSKQPSGGNITTGSPAIDPDLRYVYAYGLDGFVHKYQVGDGTEIKTGGWPELSTLKPTVEKGASGLSVATPPGGVNYLYAPMNGYGGDNGDYQGHVTTINLTSGSGEQIIFNAMCSNLMMHFVSKGTSQVDDCDLDGPDSNKADGQMSGIWGRPGAIYDAGMNRIYVATGNGLFDANATSGNHFEWGDSVLALKPDGTGSGGGLPIDSYTPSDYASLYGSDTDLGSTSPAILPSTSGAYPHLAVQGGKDGCVRLINLDNMSGAGGPGTAGHELNAASSCSADAVGGQVRTQPAVWVNPADGTTRFFIATDGGFFAFQLSVVGSSVPTLTQPLTAALAGLPGGTSPVVANGHVYYVTNSNSATIHALDAATGAQVWTSSAIGGIKWQSPIVVNGHLYVVDKTSTLWAFALDGIFRNGFQ